MLNTILHLLFAILSCLIIVQGALQCFAPARLKRIQDRLRPQHVNWSESAGGAFFEKENMSLPDWLRSGFDPAILIARDNDPTWAAEESWSAAIDSFWYRKFYSETRTGH